MAYKLDEINRRVQSEPAEFVAECDAVYASNVARAAEKIAKNIKVSHVVLLSGPSGSGKTTTARNIEARLESMGIVSHTISLDDYYKDVNPLTAPRTASGELDFESPDCLDLALLGESFRALNTGCEVMIPYFDFPSQKRDMNRARPLRLGENEIAIFEGIHALNNQITAGEEGHRAAKVYISARSNIENGGKTVYKGTWMRIIRRAVRDMKFRGASPALTFGMWENLRDGEKKYISPYKNTADVVFDSSLMYEVNALKPFTDGLFDDVAPTIERYAELCELRHALELFSPLDEKFVPETSLIREFIGGGIYED